MRRACITDLDHYRHIIKALLWTSHHAEAFGQEAQQLDEEGSCWRPAWPQVVVEKNAPEGLSARRPAVADCRVLYKCKCMLPVENMFAWSRWLKLDLG